MNQMIKELRTIQHDVSVQLDLKMADLQKNYSDVHVNLLNNVNGHIEGCNKALENQTIQLEDLFQVIDSFEHSATK